MRLQRALLAVAGLGMSVAGAMGQPISYTGAPVSQNFDSLPNTGTTATPWTNGVTLPGWYAWRSARGSALGGRDNNTPWTETATVTPGTGSGISGALYSFGLDGNTNRTLGSLGSNSWGDNSYGVVLVNDTGASIPLLNISYVGRQWRNGGNTTAQRLVFEYKVAPAPFDGGQMAATPDNSPPNGNWVAVPELDFVSPVATATGAALVGSDAANSVSLSRTVTGLTWNPGDVLYIRWFDDNDTGNDHGLGIDDFQFNTAAPLNPTLQVNAAAAPLIVEQVGGQITYTLNVTNIGQQAANAGTITAAFPANVALVSSTVPAVQNGTNVTLTLPPIAGLSPLAPITLVMQANVAFPPPAATQLNATFTANPGAGVASTSTPVVNNADVGVTATASVACEAFVGDSVVYTVTATNNGPTPASGVTVTGQVPANATLISSPTTQGTVTVANGQYTWTVGNIPALGAPTLTFNTQVAAAGGGTVNATATSTSLDLTTANNTATVTTSTASTATAIPALFSTFTGQLSSSVTVPGFSGGSTGAEFGTSGGAGTLNNFAFGRPFFSPDGRKWAMVADTTLAENTNTVIVVGDANGYRGVVRENVTIVDTAASLPMGSDPAANPVFDRILSIDNAGNLAFSGRLRTPTGDNNRRVVIKGNAPTTPGGDYTFEVVAKQGQPATVFGGTNPTWGATMSVATGGLSADGSVAFYAQSTGGDQAALTQNGTTIVSRRVNAASAPAGQAGGTTATWNTYETNSDGNFATRGFSITPDRATWMLEGSLSAPVPAASNQVLVLNTASTPNTVVLQEGSVIPGSGFTQAINSTGNFAHAEVGADGNWYAMGTNAPLPPATVGDGWVVRNGQVVAATGQPIVTGSGETWSNRVLGSTFYTVTGRGNDYVVGGLSSRLDGSTDSVLVHNGRTVLLREGDPINVGTAEVPFIVYAGNIFQNNRSAISADRRLYTVVNVRNAQWPCVNTNNVIGQVMLAIPLPAASVACSVADITGIGGPPSQPDGLLTGDDFNAFIGAFAANDLLADITGIGGPPASPDGLLTGDDFNAFIAAFAAGCP
jgi:uncharacterized repeat protein (TIGR01451 family)